VASLYSSKISAIKQLDTPLMFSNIFVKTQLQKLKGGGEEGEEGRTFCCAFYSSEIAEDKH
jgi:hypothetical protein